MKKAFESKVVKLNGTTGRSDIHCKIKETLLICVFKPAFSENVGSEKLFLY